MIEITLLGRGGQGIVTSARLLAHAATIEGWYAQKMSSYGAARRGDIVTSSVRIDRKPIVLRSPVESADYLVVCDRQFPEVEITKRAKSDVLLIVCGGEGEYTLDRIAGRVDAHAISEKVFGHRTIPLTGVVMVGAFFRVWNDLPLDALKASIAADMGGRFVDANVSAVETGYQAVSERRTNDDPLISTTVRQGDGVEGLAGYSELPIGPYFRPADMRDFATGSWRTRRPVIDRDACHLCRKCTSLCPEGIIDEKEGMIMIDYHYCKGCGICAAECPAAAIHMESDEG